MTELSRRRKNAVHLRDVPVCICEQCRGVRRAFRRLCIEIEYAYATSVEASSTRKVPEFILINHVLDRIVLTANAIPDFATRSRDY